MVKDTSDRSAYITKWKRFLHIFTTIVIASAVLSLFNSSLIELSDEKDNVRFCASTIGSISSCKKLSKSSDCRTVILYYAKICRNVLSPFHNVVHIKKYLLLKYRMHMIRYIMRCIVILYMFQTVDIDTFFNTLI